MQCVAFKPEAARKINDFVRKLGDTAVMSGYSSEPDNYATAPPRPANAAGSGAGLLSGEWKTEIADPFESMPLPQ
jgi:hypothetical protein